MNLKTDATMKRFTKALAALMLTAAVICSAGCKKEPINGGNNGNDTTDTLFYTIGVAAVPSNGGSVSGGGEYKPGQSCTVTASAADGYSFSDWTEHGSQVSTDATLLPLTAATTWWRTSLLITAAKELKPILSSGIVTGRGTFQEGQSCTVTATANYYYLFENWTEDDHIVSTDANFTFTVTCSRSLVANFTYNGAPEGAINGKFSINANGDMVYFSQGNLQYNAGINTWRFAENQFDYVGNANNHISPTYNGWIDLFGWGTSGFHDGEDPNNTNYQPWASSFTAAEEPYSLYNLWGYGPSTNMLSPDLTGNSAAYDWGVYNAISNGGDQAGLWRTLTKEEWVYVVNTRSTASGIRYAKACVDNVNGVILLPDDWDNGYYNLNNTNNGETYYGINTITLSQWSMLEYYGAVFLPAAGFRYATTTSCVDSYGIYWSASHDSSDSAYSLFFEDSFVVNPQYHIENRRGGGRSVRLVCSVQ